LNPSIQLGKAVMFSNLILPLRQRTAYHARDLTSSHSHWPTFPMGFSIKQRKQSIRHNTGIIIKKDILIKSVKYASLLQLLKMVDL
jgi:hypothetical protein